MRVAAGELRFITNPQLTYRTLLEGKSTAQVLLKFPFLTLDRGKNPAFAVPAKSNLTPSATLD